MAAMCQLATHPNKKLWVMGKVGRSIILEHIRAYTICSINSSLLLQWLKCVPNWWFWPEYIRTWWQAVHVTILKMVEDCIISGSHSKFKTEGKSIICFIKSFPPLGLQRVKIISYMNKWMVQRYGRKACLVYLDL